MKYNSRNNTTWKIWQAIQLEILRVCMHTCVCVCVDHQGATKSQAYVCVDPESEDEHDYKGHSEDRHPTSHCAKSSFRSDLIPGMWDAPLFDRLTLFFTAPARYLAHCAHSVNSSHSLLASG